MAGYSGTPLARKLGIREGARVGLVKAPQGFEQTLDELPEDVQLVRAARAVPAGRFDVLIAFFDRRAALEQRFASLAKHLEEDGGLWIAWPKKASGVATDVDDGVVRATGLGCGLVDNKVCAIDATWSGLRFVVRLRDRRKKA